MMLCEFNTEPTADGYQHTCQRCGAVRSTKGTRIVRQCDNTPQQALPTQVDHSLVALRIAVCHDCHERPQGCWKAIEYGCSMEYQKARRRAAEMGKCPIGKMTREENPNDE